MHILLFGGSFDPPHKGHQTIVQTVLHRKIAQQVWYVPCFQHPFTKNISIAHHRIEMLKLIQTEKTQLCVYEIEKASVSYSVDTLSYLHDLYPDNSFSWLIGSDLLPDFHKWKDYQTLLNHYPAYVYPRSRYPLSPLYRNMIVLENVQPMTISSQTVRLAISTRQAWEDMVDLKVAGYIKKHKLYESSTTAYPA